MRVRVTALVILEALSLAAPTARAAPASGEGPGRAHNVLRWTRTARAEGCVSAEELAAAVESRLNRKVFAGEGQPDLLIEGEVERAAKPPAWRARIRTFDGAGVYLGERELTESGESCRALDDELALVVALIIDPDAAKSARAAPPAPAAEPSAATSKLAPTSSPPSTPTARTSSPTALVTGAVASAPGAPWRFGLDASGVAALGLLPSWGFGARVAASATAPSSRWALEIAGTVFGEEETTVPAGGSRFFFWSAGAGLCPRLTSMVAACGELAAGRLRAQGFGFDQNQEPVEPRLDAGVEVRLEKRFTPGIHGLVAVGGWAALVRPRFVYRPAPTAPNALLYQPSAVAGTLRIGGGVDF